MRKLWKRFIDALTACGYCQGTGLIDNGDDSKECRHCEGKGIIR